MRVPTHTHTQRAYALHSRFAIATKSVRTTWCVFRNNEAESSRTMERRMRFHLVKELTKKHDISAKKKKLKNKLNPPAEPTACKPLQQFNSFAVSVLTFFWSNSKFRKNVLRVKSVGKCVCMCEHLSKPKVHSAFGARIVCPRGKRVSSTLCGAKKKI